MSKPRNSKARFKVADWVSFAYGAMNPIAHIIKDRGPIGFKGRRMYRIEILQQDCEPDRFEVRKENITEAAPPEKPVKVT